MFGADILFAIIFATVICKAVWDDAYCLVTGKTSARQQRIQKRIEAGKPSLTDIILDGLNTAVNGEKKPKTGEPSMWSTFANFWKEWWNDAWTEAARERRAKHRKKVEERLNGGQRPSGPGPIAAPEEPEEPGEPIPPRDTNETPEEPEEEYTPPEPKPVEPEAAFVPPRNEQHEPEEPPPSYWDHSGGRYHEPEDLPPSKPIQATAVVIRPEPIPPRAIGPGAPAALPGPARQIEPPRQNGSAATMTTSTAISTTGATAINQLANDDADPEATQQLGLNLKKLVDGVQSLFDERAKELGDIGVGGRTQQILASIHDHLDGLSGDAQRLIVRGRIHADLADLADVVGDVNAGPYLMRGRTTLH